MVVPPKIKEGEELEDEDEEEEVKEKEKEGYEDLFFFSSSSTTATTSFPTERLQAQTGKPAEQEYTQQIARISSPVLNDCGFGRDEVFSGTFVALKADPILKNNNFGLHFRMLNFGVKEEEHMPVMRVSVTTPNRRVEIDAHLWQLLQSPCLALLLGIFQGWRGKDSGRHVKGETGIECVVPVLRIVFDKKLCALTRFHVVFNQGHQSSRGLSEKFYMKSFPMSSHLARIDAYYKMTLKVNAEWKFMPEIILGYYITDCNYPGMTKLPV
ncbi:hypothetical protein EGR_01217 [Echinococcus granulosus]|uniref:Uncharacterized protein n=1 Tax=Echinococcus granulosus TaxID=6210 RepID=W6VBB2_ECHGR|nr:hypothetical protein EGR_01217 [Echinococcus granulosus]EUB64089.1 hypothetical protein EGR_01217 [Echinococcus granulosus]